MAEDIKKLVHSWLLGKKRKGTGSDRPDAKIIKLDMGGWPVPQELEGGC